MPAELKIKSWSETARRALTATEIITHLAKLENWVLAGDGSELRIEKSFGFANYFETMAFVNAVAFIAHRQDHHPDLSVQYNRCLVRFNTHDVGGISATDFECVAQIEALVS